MKKYTSPDVKVTAFDIDDIITASGVIVNNSELQGEDANMYEIYKQGSDLDSKNVSVFTW